MTDAEELQAAPLKPATAADHFAHDNTFILGAWRRWNPDQSEWEFRTDGPMEGDDSWQALFTLTQRP